MAFPRLGALSALLVAACSSWKDDADLGPLCQDDRVEANPHEDVTADLLAQVMDRAPVAAEETYDRVFDDLDAMVSAWPDLDGAQAYSGGFSNDTMTILPTTKGQVEAMLAGTYEPWTCLNLTYEATAVGPSGLGDIVLVAFQGHHYNMAALGALYLALPDITLAWGEPLFTVADGFPSTMVAGEATGEVFHYLFSVPEYREHFRGVESVTWSYFQSAPDAAPELLGTWPSEEGEGVPAEVTEIFQWPTY